MIYSFECELFSFLFETTKVVQTILCVKDSLTTMVLSMRLVNKNVAFKIQNAKTIIITRCTIFRVYTMCLRCCYCCFFENPCGFCMRIHFCRD